MCAFSCQRRFELSNKASVIIQSNTEAPTALSKPPSHCFSSVVCRNSHILDICLWQIKWLMVTHFMPYKNRKLKKAKGILHTNDFSDVSFGTGTTLKYLKTPKMTIKLSRGTFRLCVGVQSKWNFDWPAGWWTDRWRLLHDTNLQAQPMIVKAQQAFQRPDWFIVLPYP